MPNLKVEYICPTCKRPRLIEKQALKRPEFTGECNTCNRTNVTHGESKTPLWYVWMAMKSRCLRPTDKDYGRYGGRGIVVCERWLKYENFRDDMGYPEKGMTLERIDNDGPYSPENCRWTSMKEQCRNRRNGRFITFAGKTQTLAQWAEETGWGYSTLHGRLYIKGWPVERALTEKPGTYHHLA